MQFYGINDGFGFEDIFLKKSDGWNRELVDQAEALAEKLHDKRKRELLDQIQGLIDSAYDLE